MKAMALTQRQQIMQHLKEGPTTVRGLATLLGVRIRQIVEDMEHIRRSLRGRKLKVQPAECSACGMEFANRKRLTAPSRCPRCRSERTSEPVFWIE
jgi:predicted Zn-ribbon and HTH transcriptional regulator